ncbi:MAG TPA: hypothetical protein DCM86_01495 [Verrucomicrobiales bacterium]|nr:hypothetical protein [Verrucomicrobiales bacterium]
MNDQWLKEVEILNGALDRTDPAARAAYLDEACGGDPALRRRIEAMLQIQEDAEDFFAAPDAGQTRPVPPPADPAPMTLGNYKLREKLGEGGCGEVYVAEQTAPVRRRVAIKLIKPGMDTREVIARFEAERQALALMDHPNIARVFDGGTTAAGRPYFVMELVRGIRITDYCDQAQLDTAGRLELFIKVCHAIQHAHQKGVIHRDIKPSNILVTLHDGVPVPKVIDFGIAKATEVRLTEATIYTQLHQFMGTPAYMSPEQAEFSGLDIDTRSDIYSLGVLLYQLLTGRTPFEGKELLSLGVEAMRKVIREQEPRRPSTALETLRAEELTTVARQRAVEPPRLVHLLKGDLDWIVMKCLEKDRSRRYETASGLAADLLRHRENEPVLARPPSTLYRARKAVRRHRTVFAVAALLFLAVLGGLGVALVGQHRARVSEQVAIVARREAEAISDLFSRLITSPDPGRDGKSVTVFEVLEGGQAEIEKALAPYPLRQARMKLLLARTYRRLHLASQALPLGESSLDYLSTHLGADHFETLVAMYELGLTYEALAQADKASQLKERALSRARKLPDPPHLEAIQSMSAARSWPANRRQAAEGMELNEEIYELRLRAKGPEDRETLLAMWNLGSSYGILGPEGRERGMELWKRVLEMSTRRLGPADEFTRTVIHNIGVVYSRSGRDVEAAALLEEETRLCRAAWPPEDERSRGPIGYLARVYTRLGRGAEAAALYNEAVGFAQANLAKVSAEPGADERKRLQASLALALRLNDAGRFAEAEPHLRRLLTLAREKGPTADFDWGGTWGRVNLASCLGMLASCLSHQKSYPESIALYREALALYQTHPEHYFKEDRERVHLLRIQNNLGLALVGAGQYGEAEPLILAAVEGLSSPLFQTNSEDSSEVYDAGAKLYEAWGKPEKLAAWKAAHAAR